jgi:predicted O-methyltransferase YrrM
LLLSVFDIFHQLFSVAVSHGERAANTFDLVFADAVPGKYEGLDEALSVVKLGGFYVIDDMPPQPNLPDGHAAKVPVLIERLAANEDFEILPLVWASGIVVAVRRSFTSNP